MTGFLLLGLSLVLPSGCATFPTLDAQVSTEARQAPNPELADRQVLLQARAAQTIDTSDQAALTARAGALRTRAAALGGPVVTPADQQDLDTARQRMQTEAARVAPGT